MPSFRDQSNENVFHKIKRGYQKTKTKNTFHQISGTIHFFQNKIKKKKSSYLTIYIYEVFCVQKIKNN